MVLPKKKIKKPFQVFQHLINHPDFLWIVRNAWADNVSGNIWVALRAKLNLVKDGQKGLNNKRGNLNAKVDRARVDLSTFQASMPSNPSRGVLIEELRLMSLLNYAVVSQEILLKQKSRIKWLKCGDDNNRYFFNSCRGRSNQNKLVKLENEGRILVSHKDISEVAINYYKCLMGSRKRVSAIPADLCFNRLSQNQCADLVKEFPHADVSVEFFISAWVVIGCDTSDAILSFFEHYFLPSSNNSAALTLIPKNANASSMTQFRPISCCNVLYKVITKMLTNRMKQVMPFLVSPAQAAFIHGRKMGDHILLAQSLFKDYHLNTGPLELLLNLVSPRHLTV